MEFPALTRTKAEAQRFAAELFPGEETALARLKPGTANPRYQLAQDMAERLREIFVWLHEQNPRIYKPARWHLFYDLAHRLARQLDENGQAKIRDLYAEARNEEWRKSRAAQIMTGDGMGI
jgi:hypothetical protein